MDPLPEPVKQFVAAAPVCRIARMIPTGEPHVIPVCPVFDGDSTVYVDIGRRYAFSEDLSESPRIGVLIDEYDDDWSRLRGVLLRCRASKTTGEERGRAWTMIREKFPQHSSVGWKPRLTLALHVYDWRQWGVTDG